MKGEKGGQPPPPPPPPPPQKGKENIWNEVKCWYRNIFLPVYGKTKLTKNCFFCGISHMKSLILVLQLLLHTREIRKDVDDDQYLRK